MNTEEYEKAKQECWNALYDEHLKGEVQWQSVSRKELFNLTFDRAYRLGMEAAKKEQQKEPKFKVGDLCMYGGHVARVLEYIPSREFPYTVHILQMNIKTVTNGSNLESFTKPKEDKDFDNIVKDSFRNERRLNIAAMILQGMLSNISVAKTNTLAKLAFKMADALIEESQKGENK